MEKNYTFIPSWDESVVFSLLPIFISRSTLTYRALYYGKIETQTSYIICISTWSYENRVRKHLICNFSQLPLSNSLTYVYGVACLCSFFFFFFWLVLWLEICVEVNVDRITILTPPRIFFPTHNSFFKTSDSYLKSAHA